MLRKLKEKYWDYSSRKRLEASLALPVNRVMFDHVQTEREDVLRLADEGIPNQIEERLDAAVNWLLRAQNATEDHGVSLGYFPLSTQNGWKSSYPETTGYIISSLLKYAQEFERNDIARTALNMADWEIDVQMKSGAVQGGAVCPPDQQTAAAFNTGMVADGWISAYNYTGQKVYLDAALRAAEFLANDLNQAGFFSTNGDFVRGGEVKTYTCLCAWAMYRTALAADASTLKESSIRSIEAALGQRNKSGWFRNNCLTDSQAPLTHTIGYALQGIFEVGVLAARDDFVEAAKGSLAGALSPMQHNGYLSARLNHEWKPQADYACLTGSAQLAILCFRFAEQFNETKFVAAGNKLTSFVKATQLVDSANESIAGAIAGSYPILGEYMAGGYPNWATKYFIDALMLQRKLLQ
jgi:hypothetical protein